MSAQSATKIAELKLRDYGWQEPESVHPHELDTIEKRSLVIDHKGRILVGFPVRERHGLVTREQPALSLHIVGLTPQGKVDLSVALPANGWRNNSIYLNDSDQIIARANDALQMFAGETDASPTRNSWKAIAPCGLRCRIEQSSSRRTLLLENWDADFPATIVDAVQGAVTNRCAKPPYSPQSITDEYAYFSGQGRGPTYTPFLYRWPFCEHEQGIQIPLEASGFLRALNDESLVIVAHFVNRHRPAEIQILSPDGHVKFRQAIAKHDIFMNRIRNSERGDRFAIDIWTLRGSLQALDISGRRVAHRVAVYSSKTGQMLADISVNPTQRYGFDFALSPDGHRLAVVVDDVLTVTNLE